MALSIQERKEQAALRLGRPLTQIEEHRLEIDAMREAGVLIDLDVHGISMFSARVSLAEMGIGASDVRARRLRTGRKDLFPSHAKRLRSLEQRARSNLDSNSSQVTAFGDWRWLPWTNYPDFIDAHNAIVADVEQTKQDAIDRWDDIHADNAAYFEEVAREAWDARMGAYDYSDKVMIQVDHGPAFDRDQRWDFIDYIRDRALAKMPSPEAIKTGVHIDYRTAILFAPSEAAQEAAAVAEAQAAEAKAKAATAKAHQATFEAQWKADHAELQIEAYRQAELEHARQQLAEMGSPLGEALDNLRASIYSAVKGLLDGIDKHGSFRGRSSETAAGLLDYWRRLNGGLLQDDELDAALQQLDDHMHTYQAASSTEGRAAQIDGIVTQLNEIAAHTVASAQRISRAGTLEL